MSNQTLAPAWPLELIVEQAITFRQSQGRWPHGVTRQNERTTFAAFITECRQIGASHPATAQSVTALGLNPGRHTVADIATAIEQDMRGADVRNFRQNKEDIAATLEPLLRSAAVRGSIDSTVIIAGREFALSSYLTMHADNADPLPFHLAQVLDVAPPCSIGRAVAYLRARLRGEA